MNVGRAMTEAMQAQRQRDRRRFGFWSVRIVHVDEWSWPAGRRPFLRPAIDEIRGDQ